MKVNSKGKIFKLITRFHSSYLAFYHLLSTLVKGVKKRGGAHKQACFFLLKKFCLLREGLNVRL